MCSLCILPLPELGRARSLVVRAGCAVLLALLFPGCRAATSHLATRQPSNTPLLSEAFTSEGLLPSPELNPDLVAPFAPSNDRDWSADQAVLPYVVFEGEKAHVYNIRNCTYRTAEDYDVAHYDRTFDLARLRNVDFIVVPFIDMPSIAHTMLSFGFDDGKQVAVSVEIRKEKGETYGALKGFLPNYELMYVVADEHDLILKNTVQHLCDVYVYRTRATPEQARALFVDVMNRVNKLHREPEFYNTLVNNCTTNIRDHINNLVPGRVPYDYRVLLPGYSAELAYDLGLLDTDLSFPETRLRARVNYQAYLHREASEFSQLIRR